MRPTIVDRPAGRQTGEACVEHETDIDEVGGELA